MDLNQTEFFARLGAPLANPLWSWGSVREHDQTVILRAFQTDTTIIDGRRCIWLGIVQGRQSASAGEPERHRHINLVKSGCRCLLIMCRRADDGSNTIAGFNQQELFVGGEVIEHEGHFWAPMVDRVPARGEFV